MREVSRYTYIKILYLYVEILMRFALVWWAICTYIVWILLWSLTFATDKGFGFGISDSASEDDTIVARTDLNIWWVEEDKKEDFIDNIVKSFINWTLWLLWLIALIIALYGWVMMVTARDKEEQYTKWRTILKNALIWIVIIGTAWLVLSLIFWLIFEVTWEWSDGTGVWPAWSAG